MAEGMAGRSGVHLQATNSIKSFDSRWGYSLISVNDLLMGTLAPGTRTISISQAGGRVEPCTLVVPKDPLVSLREDYVLFLFQDKRTNPPNTTGSPRYARVGTWS